MKPKTIKITQVSVIVATKNEEKNIERCLKSIKNQSQKVEIIVVDNFSGDKTFQIAKKYSPNVYQAGRERSAQRNFGLKKAHGKFVLFLDADMELQKDIILQCEKLMEENSRITAVAIDEIAEGKGYLAKIKRLEKELSWGVLELEAARFFRKKDLIKIGGYDKNLISGEDWDLSIRMQKLGPFGRIKSKIIHRENKSFWQDVKKKYYYAKNIQKYAKKHPQEFEKQAGYWRFSSLFKKPKIIYDDPTAFLGLVFLKSAQYLAYLIARI